MNIYFSKEFIQPTKTSSDYITTGNVSMNGHSPKECIQPTKASN